MSTCSETAGFLISAPCKRKATCKCAMCRRPVCDKHYRKAPARDKDLCITCFRKTGARYDSEDDDPYLYSSFYYNDFYLYSSYDSDWGDDYAAFDAAGDFDDGWENDFDGS